MAYTTTVTSKGTITLPADVRRALKIKAGDRLTVERKGSVITVKPDTYDEELKKLRQEIEQELKEKGKWGVSFEEARKIADDKKLADYKEKYDVRT